MIVEEKVDWLIKSVPVEKRKNSQQSETTRDTLGVSFVSHMEEWAHKQRRKSDDSKLISRHALPVLLS